MKRAKVRPDLQRPQLLREFILDRHHLKAPAVFGPVEANVYAPAAVWPFGFQRGGVAWPLLAMPLDSPQNRNYR